MKYLNWRRGKLQNIFSCEKSVKVRNRKREKEKNKDDHGYSFSDGNIYDKSI